MKKNILKILIFGTLGGLIIGIGVGRWVLGFAFCYLIAFIFNLLMFAFNKKNNKQ